MRNKLLAFVRQQEMVKPGDTVICAVSGGADSMALLWAMHLVKAQLGISLEAAHFNHNLRGAESDRDEAFVREFCQTYGITCHIGRGEVISGEKGLEAAAREARYGFLQSLPGIIATAHTADDNAETMLMHLVRGTGLKGLGGITPKTDRLIRPMLTVTRQEIVAFLASQNISYVTDSSNETDDFLRNRIRHHVMPLLKQENPSLAVNLSATAMSLRQDEAALDRLAEPTCDVETLLHLPPAIQSRALTKLLLSLGVPEPEAGHIELLRKLLYSESPSAGGDFPGNIRIARQYGKLVKLEGEAELPEAVLQNPGITHIPQWGVCIICTDIMGNGGGWKVHAKGTLVLRSRREGDVMVLPGGKKSLKKLFIDRKIPVSQRSRVPVIADEGGVVGVVGIGPSRDRLENANVCIKIETSAEADE